MTYVRYGACFVWMATMSLTGVFVATTTASATIARPAPVSTRAGVPPVMLRAWVLL
jgi:hypothetical protein